MKIYKTLIVTRRFVEGPSLSDQIDNEINRFLKTHPGFELQSFVYEGESYTFLFFRELKPLMLD